MEKAVKAKEMLGPVPEGCFRCSQCGGEDIITDLIFPVLLKIIGMELGDEISKGKGDDVVAHSSDPVVNLEVLNARDNHCDLFISRY